MSYVDYRFARLHDANLWLCEDCGCLVGDQKTHNRHHSIESSWAWALAVLKTSHMVAHVHDEYTVIERIDSRKFDNWSADAFGEVMKTIPDDEP